MQKLEAFGLAQFTLCVCVCILHGTFVNNFFLILRESSWSNSVLVIYLSCRRLLNILALSFFTL
jgi:hypothetical protein